MKKERILWADDEIELLKPHILFLEQKGYELLTVNNGSDAIDIADEQEVDLIILDENMPDVNVLELLAIINDNNPSLVCVPRFHCK